MSEENAKPPATRDWAARLLGRDALAGLLLVVIAMVGLVGARTLGFGQTSSGGAGLMPIASAGLLGILGLLIAAQGIARSAPERVERGAVRALCLVIGAILVFAAAIRPLGLAIAGFATVTIASLADPAVRLRQAIPFAIALTFAALILFRVVLRQPIPVAPMLLGY
jgi:hypothetical protein